MIKFLLPLLLVITFLSSLNAKEQKFLKNELVVKDISAMSAPFLFELEKEQLKNILFPYLESHPQISLLKIIDNADKSLFFSFEETPATAKCPTPSDSYFEENIVFSDEPIGELLICFKKNIQAKLTKKEKDFIKKHGTVKVHNEKDWAPFNFYQYGQARGFSIDLMNLIAEKTGLKIEYITGPTWDQFLTMLENNKIDIMLNIAKSEQRKDYMIFTDPYFTPLHGLLIRSEDKNKIQSFPDILKNTTVALEKGFYYHDYFKENHPEVPLYLTNNTSESVQAVAFGQADTALGLTPVLNYFQEKNNIKSLHVIENINNTDFKRIPLRIATHKNKPELLSIIQKGLAAISPDELKKIKNRWMFLQNDSEKNIVLSPRLQDWIKKHPKIIVGGEMDWAPFDFVDENNNYNGLAKDYLDVISSLTGLKFEIRTGQTWSELLNDLKEGKLDLLPAINFNEERKKIAHFTKPYLALTDYFITKKEYPKIENIQSLYNKKVASIKGYEISHWLKKNHPKIDIQEYSNLLEALRSVESGECVAMINDNPSTTYTMEKNFITTLKINTLVKHRAPIPIYMAVKKEYLPLVEILNQALLSIPQERKKEISQKWMSKIESNNISLELNEQEIDFLIKKPTIKFAVDPNWLPLESIDSKTQQYEGMMADYLLKIKELTGLKFELVATKKWEDSVNLVASKKVDMLAAASITDERKKFLNFSHTTITLTDGVIMKNNAKFISNLNDLSGLKVGVSDGTSLHKMLKQKYPNLTLVPLKGTKVGIEELNKENIDAYIGNLEVISYIIFAKNLLNLKVVLKLDDVRELHIALHKSYPKEALSIINKAINAISKEEINIIRQKWIGLKVNEEINYSLIVKILLSTFVIIGLFIYYNRKLQRTVEERTRDLKTQISQFDKNVIFSKTDLEGNIIHASEAFCKISGYSLEELLGKPHSIMRHPDMTDQVFSELWDILQKQACFTTEIKNKKKNGDSYWLESKFEPDYNKEGEHIGYTALRIDITAKKAVEELSRSLEDKVIERTQELNNERRYINSIMNSQENIVISTDGKKIRSANKSFFKFFGIKKLEQFFEQYGMCICDVFDEDSSDEFVQKYHNDQKWVDYIVDNPEVMHKTQITLNNRSYIFSISVDKFTHNDEELEVAVFTDITELETIRKEIEDIHKNTKDSIEYASLIQHSLIPDNILFKNYFEDYLTIWHPKDIVGGDIYLFEELRDKNECLLMVIDCTGHGVPGAFVTMLVKAIERQITSRISHSDEIVSPAKILSIFNTSMKHLLKQEDENSISNAGFDGGILYYNKKENIIRFAGAEVPLFYFDENKEFQIIKGDRHSIGYKKSDANYQFKEHTIELKSGMQFYLTTDGYLDQNGGEKSFPFGKKRFKQLLEEYKDEAFCDQQEILLDTMAQYQGEEERNDDITIVGLKIR